VADAEFSKKTGEEDELSAKSQALGGDQRQGIPVGK